MVAGLRGSGAPFFFQAEDGIRDRTMTGVQTCALPISRQVLFFEDQSLTPREQRDFAALFGELHTHPLYPGDDTAPEIMLLDNHPGNPTDNDMWHTEIGRASCREREVISEAALTLYEN